MLGIALFFFVCFVFVFGLFVFWFSSFQSLLFLHCNVDFGLRQFFVLEISLFFFCFYLPVSSTTQEEFYSG